MDNYNYQPRCQNCGAELTNGQAFCGVCGASAPAPAPAPVMTHVQTCGRCGTVIEGDTVFCPACGNHVSAAPAATPSAIEAYNASVTTQTKKKSVAPIVAVILIVLAIIVAIAVYNGIQEQKAAEEARLLAIAVDEYKELANEFYLKVLASGGTMEDIGNEIQKSWRAYVNSSYYNGKRYYSVDSAVLAAQVYMLDEISDVEAADSTIEAMYRELLVVPDPNNQVLYEIKNAVKSTYEAYKEMYDCVIDPSGNYNSWTTEFANTDSNLADEIVDLRDLLS